VLIPGGLRAATVQAIAPTVLVEMERAPPMACAPPDLSDASEPARWFPLPHEVAARLENRQARES
jgi:hypothetical protein